MKKLVTLIFVFVSMQAFAMNSAASEDELGDPGQTAQITFPFPISPLDSEDSLKDVEIMTQEELLQERVKGDRRMQLYMYALLQEQKRTNEIAKDRIFMELCLRPDNVLESAGLHVGRVNNRLQKMVEKYASDELLKSGETQRRDDEEFDDSSDDE